MRVQFAPERPDRRRGDHKKRRETHADMRARQRLGVALDDELRRRIVSAIKKRNRWVKRVRSSKFQFRPGNPHSANRAGQAYRDAILDTTHTNGREVWRIDLEGLPVFRVVYEPHQRLIITVLP
jgi:hypothetical protein